MKMEISKDYNFTEVEDKIYEMWEKSGYFNPDNLKLPKNAKPYTIVLPPPNITDKLHMGHSAMLAIEDLLIRFHRMKGYRTLWVPGSDHAAIATQNAVEKKLHKEKKLTRHDLGREKFLKEVWKFLGETQKTIYEQIRKMGSSLDWSRESFTLDETRKAAVYKMFVDMYEEGLIYRGERIVNWCPRCHSTLADDELEYKEQAGKLYTFKYDKDFPINISTTRPETKLGDTAVAVNPKDKGYQKYIGRNLKANFCGIKLNLKVIADRKVKMDFGTGALGVTPAHSMADWEMAEKNNLDIIKVIDENGMINDNFGKYSGKSVLEARKMILECLEKEKLLHKEENIMNNIATCYRCGATVEPLPSKQWFVAVDKKIKKLGNKSLKEKAIEAAKSGKIKFIPERFEKRYLNWMSNLHDWCISRQIWFGHSMPVYYKGDEVYVGIIPPEGNNWKQDSDTLDTWFSSGMWTFSTLGWPENFRNNKKSGDLAKFHPTQVLNTGYEILTLWVSRMIMMTHFALNEIPFEKVYLHGLILDKEGKKMSKSRGNGIDPLEMVKKYGADAARMSVLIGTTAGNDTRLSEEKIESFRNFVTKLWNIYRYTASNDKFSLVKNIKISDAKTLADKWISSRLNETIIAVSQDIQEYKFSQAGETLQNFIWNDFADWYVEISKIENNKKVLSFVLTNILKLSHPFAPFVSEKIWQDLSGGKRILMTEKWPEFDDKLIDKKAEKEFANLHELITKIRNIRASYSIKPQVIINAFSREKKYKELIEKMARIQISDKLLKGIKMKVGKIEIILDIASQIDMKKEKIKLRNEIANIKNIINANEVRLRNKSFLKNARKEIVEETKIRNIEYKQMLATAKELLKNLQ